MDTPGGHAEPSKVDATSPSWDSQVRDELFDSFKDELHCEFNISKSEMSEPMLYAIARLGKLAGRVNFYYRVRLAPFLTPLIVSSSWLFFISDYDDSDERKHRMFVEKRWQWNRRSDRSDLHPSQFCAWNKIIGDLGTSLLFYLFRKTHIICDMHSKIFKMRL